MQLMQQVLFYFPSLHYGSFREANLFVSRLPSRLFSPGGMREKGNHYSSAKWHVIDGKLTICIHCFGTQHDRSQMQRLAWLIVLWSLKIVQLRNTTAVCLLHRLIACKEPR